MKRYLVLWWYHRDPMCQAFEARSEADHLAQGVNGAVVEVIGKDISFGTVQEWWRRNEKGEPLPFRWADK